MNAREVAEINERRRQMGAMPLGDELVALYCAPAEDHDRPYAPMVVVPTLRRPRREEFRALWLEAVRVGQRIVVMGPPMRILMPPDANPFPLFHLFRRQP